MSLLKFFLRMFNLLICFLFLLWGIGLFIFNYEVRQYKLDLQTPADNIAVLSGRNQGIFMATKLLKLGYAPFIFIASNHNRGSYTNYIKAQNILPEQFLFASEIKHSAIYEDDITTQNDNDITFIENLHQLVTHYQVGVIRVVADDIRMPRLQLEISNKLPKKIRIITHPITKGKTSYKEVFIEYNKYLLYYLAQYIGMEDELNLSYSR